MSSRNTNPHPRRSQQRAVGGVRPAGTPTEATFPILVPDNDDENESQDITALSEYNAEDSKSTAPGMRGSDVGSDVEMEAVGGFQVFNFSPAKEAISKVRGPSQTNIPTRTQALGFLTTEIAHHNHRKQYGSPPPPTRRQGRPRNKPRFSTENSFVPFKAPFLAKKIATYPSFSLRPVENVVDGTSAGEFGEMEKMNPTELITSHWGNEGFPVLLGPGIQGRFEPWDTFTMRDRLAPIEFTAAFKLKLDFFAHIIDWAWLGEIMRVEREDFLSTLKNVIAVVVKRGELVGPVGVIITHLSPIRIIQEIKVKFARQAEEEGEGCVHDEGRYGDSRNLARIDGNMENEQLDNDEFAYCLLVWLWMMEGIPERFLQGGDAEVTVGDVEKVFRSNGDTTAIPSGAVVLMAG